MFGIILSIFSCSVLFISNRAKAANICIAPIIISKANVIDESHLSLQCEVSEWVENDLISVKSKNGDVVGLFQVVRKKRLENLAENKNSSLGQDARTGPAIYDDRPSNDDSASLGKSSFKYEKVTEENGAYSLLKLVSVRENRILQPNDYFEKLELALTLKELKATSYLWKTQVLPKDTKNLYRPLCTQGETIGDTAQTLWANEYFFSAFGTLGYGISKTVSGSANLTAFALGSPNAKLKGQFYRNENQTWSLSVNMAQENNSSNKLFNVDVMWDSILSDTLIAHSIISAAVISFDSAKEVAALKSYGSSSIQTGYEYIFSDWSRFLIGPSYNIDQKAIGGYLGYVKIINNLHLQASLTTNNIRELKISAKEGYFFIVEGYWRW